MKWKYTEYLPHIWYSHNLELLSTDLSSLSQTLRLLSSQET